MSQTHRCPIHCQNTQQTKQLRDEISESGDGADEGGLQCLPSIPGRVWRRASWRRSGKPVEKPCTYSSGLLRPSGSKNTCSPLPPLPPASLPGATLSLSCPPSLPSHTLRPYPDLPSLPPYPLLSSPTLPPYPLQLRKGVSLAAHALTCLYASTLTSAHAGAPTWPHTTAPARTSQPPH